MAAEEGALGGRRKEEEEEEGGGGGGRGGGSGSGRVCGLSCLCYCGNVEFCVFYEIYFVSQAHKGGQLWEAVRR